MDELPAVSNYATVTHFCMVGMQKQVPYHMEGRRLLKRQVCYMSCVGNGISLFQFVSQIRNVIQMKTFGWTALAMRSWTQTFCRDAATLIW